MGVRDQFGEANAMLSERLGYHLDPDNADEFRSLLKRIGFKRFEHAVKLVQMRMLSQASEKHDLLIKAMWKLSPEKVGKYRNAQAQAAVELHRELDNQLAMAIERDSEGY